MLRPSGSRVRVRKSSNAQPQSVMKWWWPRTSSMSSNSMPACLQAGPTCRHSTASNGSRHSSRPSHVIRPAREELAGMRILTAGPSVAAAGPAAQGLARTSLRLPSRCSPSLSVRAEQRAHAGALPCCSPAAAERHARVDVPLLSGRRGVLPLPAPGRSSCPRLRTHRGPGCSSPCHVRYTFRCL